MTPSPDDDISAPKDPAEYRPRPLLGLGFWAMIVFGVICVLAGVGVALLAPRLLPARPSAPAVERPSAPEPPKPAASLPAEPSSAAPAPVEPVSSSEVQQLSGRLAALEAQQARSAHAAAAALAAAALVEASQTDRPFPEEAAALRTVAPAGADLAELTRLAQSGAPTRARLAEDFPDYAARAASAARRPGQGASLGRRIAYGLSQVVMVRRVGDVPGTGTDALLARAERRAQDGDLEGALQALDQLPPAAREAMEPWRARAERRAAIDRYAAGLRASALRDLAGASRSGA
jgi:hypothetical protein